MNIYLAPLEGITNNIYRESQHTYFGGMDKYFTPFIAPNEQGILNTKVIRDILPENNKGMNLVPQILTNSADGFIIMCKTLEQYGYTEFNLNLGCPSGTVVSKGRGSGFLAYPDELDKFLDEIYKSGYNISIKTRIGKESPEEFYRLLEIYNQYPLTELIIHPRTRKDMYKNTPNWDMYKYAIENSKHKLCYNGDIFTVKDYNNFIKEFPNTDTIMVGRGIISNPALACEIKGIKKLNKDDLYKFYEKMFNDYKEILSGDTPLLHKMKEVFVYMIDSFNDCDKIAKKIKKAKNVRDFKNAVNELFSCCEVI